MDKLLLAGPQTGERDFEGFVIDQEADFIAAHDGGAGRDGGCVCGGLGRRGGGGFFPGDQFSHEGFPVAAAPLAQGAEGEVGDLPDTGGGRGGVHRGTCGGGGAGDGLDVEFLRGGRHYLGGADPRKSQDGNNGWKQPGNRFHGPVIAPFLCVGKYFAGPAVGSFGFAMETSGSWRWPRAAKG